MTGLHGFLSTLLKLEGARVAQVPVHQRPRVRGRAEYRLWNRLVGPLFDLFAVRWMRTLGLGGQGLSTGRFPVQWVTSERKRRSTMPKAFW